MASLQNDSFGVMRAVRICSGRKPGFTCDIAQKLRIISPAPITSITAKATSATTNPPRNRWDTDTAVPRPPEFNASVRVVRAGLWLLKRSEEHTSELQSHFNLVC